MRMIIVQRNTVNAIPCKGWKDGACVTEVFQERESVSGGWVDGIALEQARVPTMSQTCRMEEEIVE